MCFKTLGDLPKMAGTSFTINLYKILQYRKFKTPEFTIDSLTGSELILGHPKNQLFNTDTNETTIYFKILFMTFSSFILVFRYNWGGCWSRKDGCE